MLLMDKRLLGMNSAVKAVTRMFAEIADMPFAFRFRGKQPPSSGGRSDIPASRLRSHASLLPSGPSDAATENELNAPGFTPPLSS